MHFNFAPVTTAPSATLLAVGYDALHLEVIDHVTQLAAALTRGEIGFEWYTELSQIELARVGWDCERPCA